jgi:hypothetical protein
MGGLENLREPRMIATLLGRYDRARIQMADATIGKRHWFDTTRQDIPGYNHGNKWPATLSKSQHLRGSFPPDL